MDKNAVINAASLRDLNTFGIDVNCNCLCIIQSVDEAIELLNDPEFKDLEKLVLGGGSNILFTKDYDGLVILNRIHGISLLREDDLYIWVKAGGGVPWHELVMFTVERGWGGLENLSLIPGTVGAAPIQNIGAYGVEMKDTFVELEAVSLEDGTLRKFNHENCKFGYRDSYFKREGKGKFLIANVTFRLSKKPVVNTSYGAITQELQKKNIFTPSPKDVSDAVISIRSSKLPDPSKIGNAGSFFKNPEVSSEIFMELKKNHPEIVAYPSSNGMMKLAAGWLIEKCGWKGLRQGNVGMHRDQALVLVNHGNASGKELILHALRVQESVKNNFGVNLELEVNIL
ncbi:MAG: UDP-N-acetylmuramate dehydrogenase [Bacteroidota bacterium]